MNSVHGVCVCVCALVLLCCPALLCLLSSLVVRCFFDEGGQQAMVCWVGVGYPVYSPMSGARLYKKISGCVCLCVSV